MHKEMLKNEILKVFNTIEERCVPKVSDIISPLKKRTVIIYGAGSFGKEMLKIFKEYELEVYAFLDIKARQDDSLFGIPVYKADDSTLDEKLKEEAVVVFSIVIDKRTRDKIISYIKDCGFKNILNAQSIRCRFVNADQYPYEIIGTDYLETKMNEILSCINFWADTESANIYKTNLVAHVLRDYGHCIESEGQIQYFLKDFKFNKGFSRFIDCGGYIGDTLTELVRTQGKAKAAASFEPNNENYLRLSQTADSLRKEIEELYLFPCGVSDKTELLAFNNLGGSSSITATGESHVQCVALDDVLKGFAPTFIKMDVEGAELRALLGAQHMIREYKPDLAICLYHSINHLWDVPLLINSWELGYKFYLRTHNACTMETVMYAVSES